MYILEKCKLYNKPLIIQTNSKQSFDIKISTLDFIVKQGIDAIIIKDEVCELNEYVNILKSSRKAILDIEKKEDNINKYNFPSR